MKDDDAIAPEHDAGVASVDLEAKPRRRRTAKLRVVAALQLAPDWKVEPGVPRTRAECVDGPRPCPRIACRHHLWLRLKEEQPGNPQAGKQGDTTFRPSTMQSCSLDVAEKGASFEEIGNVLGMDSTRARQIAQAGLEKLKALGLDVDVWLRAL